MNQNAAGDANPYDVHGAALLDCYRGRVDGTLIVHQDGVRDDVPAAFWLRQSFSPLEERALQLCRGRILDVGAGAGLHSLELQQRGQQVMAIDVSTDCVTIMRERGVREARVEDMFEFKAEPFDTILSLCNGLDKVGCLADLPRFLDRMSTLLAPGGQLIADSFDLRVGADEERLSLIALKEAEGRYFGEVDLRFEYGGLRSANFTALHVDPDMLSMVALECGWRSEILERRGSQYLARLDRPTELPVT